MPLLKLGLSLLSAWVFDREGKTCDDENTIESQLKVDDLIHELTNRESIIHGDSIDEQGNAHHSYEKDHHFIDELN